MGDSAAEFLTRLPNFRSRKIVLECLARPRRIALPAFYHTHLHRSADPPRPLSARALVLDSVPLPSPPCTSSSNSAPSPSAVRTHRPPPFTPPVPHIIKSINSRPSLSPPTPRSRTSLQSSSSRCNSSYAPPSLVRCASADPSLRRMCLSKLLAPPDDAIPIALA
ncbi:hypothetical protein C8R46DRAFT_1354326 [Mycena filopes]|nr:hypothetical protein C8R46DRAFT_1354326 [Mycena filopes]